jgi:hypothetical protein
MGREEFYYRQRSHSLVLKWALVLTIRAISSERGLDIARSWELARPRGGRFARNEPAMNSALDMAPAQPRHFCVGQVTGIPVLQSTQS